MATLKYAKVLVVRNPMEKIAKTVPLHEVPVLRDVHGAGAVIVEGEVSSEMPVPDVEAEFERLRAVYGQHPEINMPYVEHVYGGALTGGLGRALESATDHADAQPSKKAARAEREAATA